MPRTWEQSPPAIGWNLPDLAGANGFQRHLDRASSRTSPAPPMARAAPTAARRQCRSTSSWLHGDLRVAELVPPPQTMPAGPHSRLPCFRRGSHPAPPGVAVVTCRGTGLSRCRIFLLGALSPRERCSRPNFRRTPFPVSIPIRPARGRPMPPSISSLCSATAMPNSSTKGLHRLPQRLRRARLRSPAAENAFGRAGAVPLFAAARVAGIDAAQVRCRRRDGRRLQSLRIGKLPNEPPHSSPGS